MKVRATLIDATGRQPSRDDIVASGKASQRSKDNGFTQALEDLTEPGQAKPSATAISSPKATARGEIQVGAAAAPDDAMTGDAVASAGSKRAAEVLARLLTSQPSNAIAAGRPVFRQDTGWLSGLASKAATDGGKISGDETATVMEPASLKRVAAEPAAAVPNIDDASGREAATDPKRSRNLLMAAVALDSPVSDLPEIGSSRSTAVGAAAPSVAAPGSPAAPIVGTPALASPPALARANAPAEAGTLGQADLPTQTFTPTKAATGAARKAEDTSAPAVVGAKLDPDAPTAQTWQSIAGALVALAQIPSPAAPPSTTPHVAAAVADPESASPIEEGARAVVRPTRLADIAIDNGETAAPEIVVNAVAVRQQVAFASAPSVTTAASTQASAPHASSSSDRRSMPIDHASIAEPQAAPAVDRPGGEDHPAGDERQPMTSLAGTPTDLAANAPQGLTQTAGVASHGKAHAAAAGSTSSAPTLTEAPQTAASPTTASMPRSMTLQLGIAHLGTVKVELHSTGRSLDVTLSADDARTVGVLQRGHDDLARALRDQNYDLTSLVVHGGDQTDNSPGERHGSAQQGSSQNTDRNGPSGSPPGRSQTGSGRREPGSPREDATARGGNSGRDRAGVLLV